MMKFSIVLIAVLVILQAPGLLLEVDAQTSDWSQWRGPGRDGINNSLQWPDSLNENWLIEQQSIPLGPSYSGPIVVDDRVFVTETRDKANEVVKAIDINSGQVLWSTQWVGAMEVPFFAAANGSWIRATPAYDDGRLYVAGIREVLVCLDANDGQEVWRRDFPSEVGTPLPAFGFVSSPLVDGDFVYVQAAGGFVKLDKKTGETVWSVLKDGGGMNGSAFSSPFLTTIAGQRQFLIQGREKLLGVDPESGNMLWSKPIKAFRGMNIVTPTVFQDGVFVSTYGGTSQLLEISQESVGAFSVDQAWSKPIQGYMTSPVIVDGHAYLMLRNQRFACFDLKTGEAKWRTRPYAKYASLVAAGDKILALNSDGNLMMIKANPKEFELIDSRKVAADSWAHLAATKKHLVVRDLNELKIYQWKSP